MTVRLMQESPKHSDEDEVAEASDSRGISGWDKVDALAEALLSLSGMAVTNKQARHIRSLYDALEEFDKRPLTFSPQPSPQKKNQGRFGRSKVQRRSGHITVENMKR